MNNRSERAVVIPQVILNAVLASTGGSGTTVDVSKYQKIGVLIIGSGGANFTVKLQGAFDISGSGFNFGAAASPTNPWGFMGAKSLDTTTHVDGATGYVFAADGVKLLEIDTSTIRFLNAAITAGVAGNVTVIAFPLSNL